MKDWILTIIGAVGGFVTALFGGWDTALMTLIILDRKSTRLNSSVPRQ